MRTAGIRIDGKEYTLAFSARTMRSCTDRYGSMAGLGEALDQEDEARVLDECIWLLSVMMDAGARYQRLNGQDAQALDYDSLYDLCGMDDIVDMRTRIMETISRGTATEIKAEPGKNAETTPAS